MKWFYNLKIGTKLLSAFIVVAFVAGIIGVMGVVNINKVSDLNTEMYQKMTEPLGVLIDVTNAYQNMRSNVRDIMLTSDQNEISQFENQFDSNSTSFDKSVSTFSKTLLTDKGQEMVKSLQKAKDKYIECSKKVISLDKEGKNSEALALFYSDGKTAANDFDSGMKNIISLKLQLAKENYNGNIKTVSNSVLTSVILIIAGIIIAIGLGIFISTIISRPIRKLMKVADKVADGDLNVHVDISTKDEVGMLGAAFRRMADNLNDVMRNINMASEQVASGSKQVSESSIALSQGATEQATSVEQLTASLEEISSQTKLNAENANQANQLAETAKLNALQGNSQMQEMLNAMDGINNSSANISKIIKVIDDIAFQTNILALNAAVEAARAGQHGKGFAVVAEEVRNLAARSANAAKETTDLIEGSIKKVEGGTKIATDTAGALKMIVSDIEKVANLVNNIACASNEQATGIGQVNQGIMQVSQVVQTNSATSEECAAASEELSSQAQVLKDMISKFKLRQTESALKNMDGLQPDVIKMLENVISKNKASSTQVAELKTSSIKPKIILDDKEFGKY